MKAKFLSEDFKYDGSQLRAHFAYLQHKILGDSIVSWVGACDVDFAHMVDGEDLLAQAEIRGARMLHFIVEKFDISLFAAVGLQRLLAAIVRDQLRILAPEKSAGLFRDGDDLYLGDRKLSISIATVSPVSTLIHFAVNVTNAGTPVKTLALEDLSVTPHVLAEKVMTVFCNEVKTITEATQKVRAVR